MFAGRYVEGGWRRGGRGGLEEEEGWRKRRGVELHRGGGRRNGGGRVGNPKFKTFLFFKT
jgi:hypothetical protein